MFFKKNITDLNYGYSRGFGVLEVVAVVTIISFLAAIIIANSPESKKQLALSRTAFTFAQNLRRAQGLALSEDLYKDSNGVWQAVDGFGGYVDLLANTQYIIYADRTPGNQQYGVGVDYIESTINLDPGIYIKEIKNVSGGTVSINFKAPIPTTNITPEASLNTVEVVFAIDTRPTVTKTVSINTVGLVEVIKE